jgi:hypothetical protein
MKTLMKIRPESVRALFDVRELRTLPITVVLLSLPVNATQSPNPEALVPSKPPKKSPSGLPKMKAIILLVMLILHPARVVPGERHAAAQVLRKSLPDKRLTVALVAARHKSTHRLGTAGLPQRAPGTNQSSLPEAKHSPEMSVATVRLSLQPALATHDYVLTQLPVGKLPKPCWMDDAAAQPIPRAEDPTHRPPVQCAFLALRN